MLETELHFIYFTTEEQNEKLVLERTMGELVYIIDSWLSDKIEMERAFHVKVQQ